MVARTQHTSSGDEAESEDQSISLLISGLRTAFRTVDFNRVEEALVVREAKLKREVKKLKEVNAVLEEKHQLDLLEKLKLEDERNHANERYEKLLEEVKRGVECDDEGAICEFRRKNRELESEKMELQNLIKRKYTEWESRISRLEENTERLRNELLRRSTKMERSENNGMIADGSNNNRSVTSSPVIDLEKVFDYGLATGARGSPLSDNLHSKGNGDFKTSAVRKLSPGGTVLIIDSDDDCAPYDTVWQKKTSEKPKDNNYMGLTSVEKKPKVLKRRRALLSANENEGEIFEQEITPTSEKKQHVKSSLEPSRSVLNHCSEAVAIIDPTIHAPVILGQTEEKMGAEHKSQSFVRSLAEVSDDCDSSDCSTSSSSSSHSEGDGKGPLYAKAMQYIDAMQKVKERKDCLR